MRIAYLDCFSGISGDMFLGALVDAGVPFELLEETVRALNLGATLECSQAMRSGLAATKIDVLVDGERDMPREEFWAQQHAHEQAAVSHSHQHEHGQAHSHDHSHEHAEDRHSASEAAAHSHRGLREICAIIDSAPISSNAKAIAARTFELLGEAEARIHNRDLETIHFHEVGSVDAIVDVVCAAVGADWLNIDRWLCSPLNVGEGTVTCAHGTLPVPAPATLELLKDAPIYSSGIRKELVTPTGAAIVRSLVNEFASRPAMRVSAVGYGAGARDFPSTANVARLSVGESLEAEDAVRTDTVSVLEANVDDMTAEVAGYVLERLMASGALDAFVAPVQMKKSRPGLLLTVLSRPEDAERLTALLFAETTTLGVRTRREQRRILDREHVTVESLWGPLRIKVARLNGEVANFAPEFEDCRSAAVAHGIPLKQIMQEAVRLYLEATERTANAATHRNSNHG